MHEIRFPTDSVRSFTLDFKVLADSWRQSDLPCAANAR